MHRHSRHGTDTYDQRYTRTLFSNQRPTSHFQVQFNHSNSSSHTFNIHYLLESCFIIKSSVRVVQDSAHPKSPLGTRLAS